MNKFMRGINSHFYIGTKLLIVTWNFLLITSCLGVLIDDVQLLDTSDVFFEITDPKELAFTYKIRPALDFGRPFNSSFAVANKPLVLANPLTACSDILNKYSIKGNVAFVQRGDCSFLSKISRMERAGAIAVIVSDNDGDNDEIYVEMVDDNSLRDVNIPAGFLLGKNGFVIMNTLEKLKRKHAIINLPVNISNIPIHKWNQPPWISW